MKKAIENEIAIMNKKIISHIANISRFPIAIYPYSPYTTKTLIKQLSDEFGFRVKTVYYHCDDKSEQSEVEGVPVLPFSELMSSEIKETCMIVLSDCENWLLDFWCLQWNGITSENMLNLSQLDYYKRILEGNLCAYSDDFVEISQNIDACEKAYELMSDDKSKQMFLRIVANKMAGCNFYFDVCTENQYFDRNLIGELQDEVFFDVGAYDGDTIMKFIACCPQYKAIYAFEPDKSPFVRLCNNTSDLKNVICLNAGLSDINGEVQFTNKDLGSSHIIGNYPSDIREEKCYNILSLKGDILNLCPTFIKMDIEGAEFLAITGLHETIRKYTPKLAICLYHRLSDLWNIPLLIHGINENYLFKLAHHSYRSAETVLYAVSKDRRF